MFLLLKHSVIYVLARGVPGLITFAALAIYTRLLSPEQYGEYALVIATVSLMNALIFNWLRLGATRFLTSHKHNRQIFLATILVGFTGVMALTAVVGIAAIWLWGGKAGGCLMWTIGLCFLWVYAWFELNLELLRAELDPRQYGFLQIEKAILSMVLGALFVYFGGGALGLLSGVLLGTLLPLLILRNFGWRALSFKQCDRAILSELVSFGLPLTLTFAMGFIVSSSDRLLLGWLKNVEETGGYAIAYDLSQQTLGVLIMTITLAAYPLIVHALEHEGRAAAREHLRHNAVLLLLVSLPATAGMILLAPNIAAVVLGCEFRESATIVIPWIAVSSLLAGLKNHYLDRAFSLSKRTLVQIWPVLISAILSVLLNLWWIPAKGMLGAAYSSVIAYAVALVLSWQLGKRLFPIPFPLWDFFKITLATLGMSFCLWPVLPYRGVSALLAQIILGVFGYAALVFVFNVGGMRVNMVTWLGMLHKEQQ